MAEFKEVSPDAPFSVRALNWVDNRFPASKLYNEHLGQYYAPKNFNFWYILRFACACWCWCCRSSPAFS